MVIIILVIISPPLIKSNIDIVLEGTFLLTIKAIIDITTAIPPPKIISRTCSAIRRISETPNKTVEIVNLCRVKDFPR